MVKSIRELAQDIQGTPAEIEMGQAPSPSWVDLGIGALEMTAAGDVKNMTEGSEKFSQGEYLKGLAQTAEGGLPLLLAAIGSSLGPEGTAGGYALGKGTTKAAKSASEVIQKISSADTSIRQVPALFKSKVFNVPENSVNLDIGGGRFDLGSKYLRDEKNITNLVLDPFNRSQEHNNSIKNYLENNKVDSVTVANVLNVIEESDARKKVIENAYNNLKQDGKSFFQIYLLKAFRI